jgi:hypothetical protein
MIWDSMGISGKQCGRARIHKESEALRHQMCGLDSGSTPN